LGPVPGVRPRRAELARRLPRERTGTDRVARGRLQDLLERDGMEVALGGCEPDRPRPGAVGAERQGGRDLPPAADAARGEDGSRSNDVYHLGYEDERGDLAGVTARLVARCDDDVDAGLDLATGMLRRADERGDEHALRMDLVDDVARRRAERVDQQLDRVGERDVHLRAG